MGAIFSLFLGSRLGVAALAGLFMIVALPITFGAGVLKGRWETEASMISAIEKAKLEAEIANLKDEVSREKAAKETSDKDAAELEEKTKLLAGEVNEYKTKLEQAGDKCTLDADDVCNIYGLRSPQCKRKRQSSSDQYKRLANILQACEVASRFIWKRQGGLEAVRCYQ